MIILFGLHNQKIISRIYKKNKKYETVICNNFLIFLRPLFFIQEIRISLISLSFLFYVAVEVDTFC